MAQSALTVTPTNPTPPTNFSFLGTTPPVSPAQVAVDDGSAGAGTAFAAKLASADNTNFPSLDAEGRGTEVVVTQGYSAGIYNPAGPLMTVSCLGSYTTTPNAQHASSLSPSSNPTLVSISPTSTASGSGTVTITCTGTMFTKQSVVYANGVAQPTTYVSATSLTAAVTKKSSAGTWLIKVVTGSVVETAPQTLTWT
jgi:hypothetical protein